MKKALKNQNNTSLQQLKVNWKSLSVKTKKLTEGYIENNFGKQKTPLDPIKSNSNKNYVEIICTGAQCNDGRWRDDNE